MSDHRRRVAAPIDVVIVDDHRIVRTGLRALLETQPDFRVVAEAADGREAELVAAEVRPHIVLMDLQMPGVSGVDATRRITQQYETSVIVVTTFDTDADIRRAMAAGASGFVVKDAEPDELFQTVRTVAGGGVALTPRAAAVLLERGPMAGHLALSSREIEVLERVATGESNREIGDVLAISEPTVKTHLRRIYDKLGVTDRTRAVTAAIERGIIRLRDTP